MRPLAKWLVGKELDSGKLVENTYSPHRESFEILIANIGSYCSYCEVFSSDLEVEHVISQHQDRSLENDWNNFLLSCSRCNGKDNKSNKHVDLQSIYLPHINNTLLGLKYCEGGLVVVNPVLLPEQQKKGQALIDLLGLDKYPNNPKYEKIIAGDRRWEYRRQAWELATAKLRDYEAQKITADKIVEFAKERGFFSVWFSVFESHVDVKQELITKFIGTHSESFDQLYRPIPRNCNNEIDSL